MPGDYPDPTILHDGKDFYMTHSSFYYKPGFLIWHSTDLRNWEPLCRVLPEYTGSAMAPDLVKCNGKYYLYYPADGVNWVVWADDIRGPWSKPVRLDVKGIDPGHVVDGDGKRWLFVDKGEVVPLSDDGLKVMGEKCKVYGGWRYPDTWDTECMCLESPKLTYHDGYYYITSAEGGTAGPATSHMVVSARSKSLFGPWEDSPYNPIVHTWSADEQWWSKGHGTLVDDNDGNWWIVYHAYAKGLHSLGRQTLIDPIRWTNDGWFTVDSAATRSINALNLDGLMPLSDNFTGKTLGLQWTFWKEFAPGSITLGNGLTMAAKGSTPEDAHLLMTTATDESYYIETEINLNAHGFTRGYAPTKLNAQGGLLLYYSDKGWTGLTSDGNTFTIWENKEKYTTKPNSYDYHFWVRLHNSRNKMTIEVSGDGRRWTTLCENVDISAINHNNYGGFYALRPTLCAIGDGSVACRYFLYQKEPLADDHIADKPLFRDPFTDGAADPTVIYNKARKTWWMFYTNRRANLTGGRGVEWVHGTPIGIAESVDGAHWHYVGNANIGYGQDKDYTYWAPDIIEDKGVYHMFLTVVPGTFDNWHHPREMVHLTSTNLWDWTFSVSFPWLPTVSLTLT